MSFRRLMDLYQLFWTFESHAHQRLAWDDAAEARVARLRAEAQAAAQLQAMLNANPSGQLGNTKINDPRSLDESGLL